MTLHVQTPSGGGTVGSIDSVGGMIASMQNLVLNLNKGQTTQMEEQENVANNAAEEQIAVLNNINSKFARIDKIEDRTKWLNIGTKIFSFVVGLCLIPIDPALSMSLMTGQGLSISGLLSDVVNWLSDEIQKVMPDLNDTESKALADVIIVATFVAAAVVIGILTAGVGDEVLAEGAADVVEKDVAGAVEKDVVGGAKKAIKPTAGQRGKRALKFAMLVGSQTTMQTNMDVNIVSAVASTTSNPDSKAWKAAEFVTFIAQTVTCIVASIGAMCMKAPDMMSDRYKGKSGFAKVMGYARKAAYAAGMIEAIFDAAAGVSSARAGYNYLQVSQVVATMILLNSLASMSSETAQENQKKTTALEKSIFNGELNLANIIPVYEMPA